MRHGVQWLSAVAAGVLVLSMAASAAGARAEVPVGVTVNGFALEMEGEALARDGVTMVPAEAFLEALGGPVVSAGGVVLPGGMLYRWAGDGAPALTVRWYDRELTLTPGKEGAELREGVLWVPLRPLAEELGFTVVWDGTADLSYPRKQVYAGSLEELFNAVAPDTEITLAPGEYSFADLDPAAIENPYVEIDRAIFDPATGSNYGEAWQMVIQNVRDLRINAGNCRIATPWAYADVWHFKNCRRLVLEGGTAVHDVEPGYCQGSCVEVEDCRDVLLSSVTLDGSGAYGLSTVGSRNVVLSGSIIQNCTYGAASLWDSEHIELTGCTIQNCAECYHLLDVANTGNVRLWECSISENSAAVLTETHYGSRNVVFEGCDFGENRFGAVNAYGWQSSGGAVFLECTGL